MNYFKKDKMQKVWRDIHFLAVFYVTFFIVFLIYVLIVFIKEGGFGSVNRTYLWFVVIFVFPTYFFVGIIRNKLTYITKDGIRIGNAHDDAYGKFFLKQKQKFFTWDEVKKIKIIGRQVPRPGYSWIIDYLIITTTDGKKYECFIAQPKGFVQALRQLKKAHLLSKDSKYLE